jgi:hypothetical protein
MKQTYDSDRIRVIQFLLRVQDIALCLYSSRSCPSQLLELCAETVDYFNLRLATT